MKKYYSLKVASKILTMAFGEENIKTEHSEYVYSWDEKEPSIKPCRYSILWKINYQKKRVFIVVSGEDQESLEIAEHGIKLILKKFKGSIIIDYEKI